MNFETIHIEYISQAQYKTEQLYFDMCLVDCNLKPKLKPSQFWETKTEFNYRNTPSNRKRIMKPDRI